MNNPKLFNMFTEETKRCLRCFGRKPYRYRYQGDDETSDLLCLVITNIHSFYQFCTSQNRQFVHQLLALKRGYTTRLLSFKDNV